MHIITLASLESTELESIIETSIRIKQQTQSYEGILKGKSLYMLFEKTSTRTALAFGLGFNELGGRYFVQRWEDSNFVVGDIADETRYVARNVDIILARLKRNETIERMARFSPVPVINGCCNRYHPTQALGDCMTVKEKFGTYKKTLLYIGIWNNVFNSLLTSFPRLGGRLIGVCPIINEAAITEWEIPEILKTTKGLELYRSDIMPEVLKALVDQADIVYVDTWVDMEYFNNPAFKELKDERRARMKRFALTPELLRDSRAVVMHDMPIHAGYELTREVVEAHLETILDQAENRRHVAKGIFAHLLGAKA